MVLSFYCISHFIDIILDIFTRFTTVLGNFVCFIKVAWCTWCQAVLLVSS